MVVELPRLIFRCTFVQELKGIVVLWSHICKKTLAIKILKELIDNFQHTILVMEHGACVDI